MTAPDWLPPRPELPEEAPAAPEPRYAGWLERVAATLIDGLLISVPVVLLVLAVAGDTIRDDDSQGAIMLNLLLIFLPLVYAGVTMRRPGEHNGQTLGKQAMGIRVVREDGASIGFWWAVGRELVKNIITTLTIGVNYLWPLWDRKNQALHDKLMHDVIVPARGQP